MVFVALERHMMRYKKSCHFALQGSLDIRHRLHSILLQACQVPMARNVQSALKPNKPCISPAPSPATYAGEREFVTASGEHLESYTHDR